MESFETRATLSIVATPIGNLGDITLRALQTLKDADVIACEDTRVSSKLLARYEIKKPLLIFHAQSGPQAGRRILALLGEGKWHLLPMPALQASQTPVASLCAWFVSK